MPVGLKALESRWDAAFEQYRKAVHRYGCRSPEAQEAWEIAMMAIDDLVAKANARTRVA